jgi:hypothetical protein
MTPNLGRKDSPPQFVGKSVGLSEQINKFMKTFSIKFNKEAGEIQHSPENRCIQEPETTKELISYLFIIRFSSELSNRFSF